MELDQQSKSVLDMALESVKKEPPAPLKVVTGKSGALLVPPQLIDTVDQPREDFGKEEGVSLVDSILAEREAGNGIEGTGILAPLLLRPGQHGRFILIAGERRLKAALEGELPYVPCIIQDVSALDAYRIGITENIQRKSLSPVEEGDAYVYLQERGDTIFKISQMVGVTQAHINKRLAVARRAPDLREMVQQRPGTMEHSRLIEKVKQPEERARLIKRVVEEKAPVEAIQEEIRQLDRRGLVVGARVSSSGKQNGSIGKAVLPPKVFVNWDGIATDLGNSTARLNRNLMEHPPKGKIRSKLLDAIAAAEKDLRAARMALGSDLEDED